MITEDISAEPVPSCSRCPRLVEFREETATREPGWFNGAVPSFGDVDAQLLIVGLAPGLRGANRTGRPFTGDWAGDLLYATLEKFGFTQGRYDARADDGLELVNAMITNAVRCVPPQNKPIGAEINACRPFLAARVDALPQLKTLITLGKISHDSTVRAFGLKLKDHPFGHQASYRVKTGARTLTLISSYHCSRYNTNTRRLTTEMFENVFADARRSLSE